MAVWAWVKRNDHELGALHGGEGLAVRVPRFGPSCCPDHLVFCKCFAPVFALLTASELLVLSSLLRMCLGAPSLGLPTAHPKQQRSPVQGPPPDSLFQVPWSPPSLPVLPSTRTLSSTPSFFASRFLVFSHPRTSVPINPQFVFLVFSLINVFAFDAFWFYVLAGFCHHYLPAFCIEARSKLLCSLLLDFFFPIFFLGLLVERIKS